MYSAWLTELLAVLGNGADWPQYLLAQLVVAVAFWAVWRLASDMLPPVQALLEAQMACGVGICYSCAVFPRRGGVQLVCADGPMFDLRDLYA